MSRYRSEFGQDINKIQKKKFRIRDFISNFRNMVRRKNTLNKRFREEKFRESSIFSDDLDYPQGVEKLFHDYMVIPKVAENEVERRVLYSEMIQLFYLLTSGALDKEPDLEKQVDLAYSLLETINKKNKEETMADMKARGTEPITIGAEIKYPRKTKTTIAATTLELSGAYRREDNLANNMEVATSPTASPRTFLREVLMRMKLGWRPHHWIIHETVSVPLDKSHTEIMDITAIQEAAGLLFPERSLQLSAEKYEKESYINDYFPFHKARTDFTHDVIEPYARKKGEYTEIRSLIKHDPVDFPRLVRQVTFTYLASFGIEALYVPSNERTPIQERLALNFKNLLFKWQALLQECGIHNPTRQERVGSIDFTTDSDSKTITKYHVLLREIRKNQDRILADDNTFQEKTRELIREYNKEARKILKY